MSNMTTREARMRCEIVLVRLPTVLSNMPRILIVQLSACMCVAAASVLNISVGRSGIANVSNISLVLKHNFNS